MSGYVRTYRKKWHSPALRQLSDDGWKVFDYLYSCPQGNLLGVYVLRAAAAVEDLNWLDMKDLAKGFDRFAKAFTEVLEVHRSDNSTGLVFYDPDSEVVMVKSFIEHNPITNPNQVKAAITKLGELPYTPLLAELKSCIREISKEYKEGLYLPLLKALDKALAKGLPKDLDKGLGKDLGKGLDKGKGKGSGKALAIKKKKEETEEEEEKEVVAVSPDKKTAGETLPDFSDEDMDAESGDGFPIFECQYFKVGDAFMSKLLDEYPLLDYQAIVKILSRIEDFIDDNPKHYKRKASGEVKSPKRIIKNWLDKEEIPAQKGGGAQAKRDRQKAALKNFASS